MYHFSEQHWPGVCNGKALMCPWGNYFTWRPLYICHHISQNSFRMRMFQTKVAEKSKHAFCVQYLLLILLFVCLSLSLSLSLSNRAVYEIICKNTFGPERPLLIAYSIPKTTNTHSEYVMPFAVPPQHLFGRLGNVLDDMWSHCSIPKRAHSLPQRAKSGSFDHPLSYAMNIGRFCPRV